MHVSTSEASLLPFASSFWPLGISSRIISTK